MKIEIKIKNFFPGFDDPKFKAKRIIETIAGVIQSFVPHNKFEITYWPNKNSEKHKLFFGTKPEPKE